MEKPKAYVVKMSTRDNIQIDADEVALVLRGITQGQPIKVRRGIINPSFYTAIVEDVDRIKSYLDEINRIADSNLHYENYQLGHKKELPEFQSLADIFEGVKLLSDGTKKIGN